MITLLMTALFLSLSSFVAHGQEKNPEIPEQKATQAFEIAKKMILQGTTPENINRVLQDLNRGSRAQQEKAQLLEVVCHLSKRANVTDILDESQKYNFFGHVFNQGGCYEYMRPFIIELATNNPFVLNHFLDAFNNKQCTDCLHFSMGKRLMDILTATNQMTLHRTVQESSVRQACNYLSTMNTESAIKIVCDEATQLMYKTFLGMDGPVDVPCAQEMRNLLMRCKKYVGQNMLADALERIFYGSNFKGPAHDFLQPLLLMVEEMAKKEQKMLHELIQPELSDMTSQIIAHTCLTNPKYTNPRKAFERFKEITKKPISVHTIPSFFYLGSLFKKGVPELSLAPDHQQALHYFTAITGDKILNEVDEENLARQTASLLNEKLALKTTQIRDAYCFYKVKASTMAAELIMAQPNNARAAFLCWLLSAQATGLSLLEHPSIVRKQALIEELLTGGLSIVAYLRMRDKKDTQTAFDMLSQVAQKAKRPALKAWAQQKIQRIETEILQNALEQLANNLREPVKQITLICHK